MELFDHSVELSSSDDGKPTFFNSVLCLQICGLNEGHLSVIDVPGIFKNTTPGRTTKNDIAMVRNMVLRYMQNRRSIMLTVVSANVDIATQEIIELAREVDPSGERTLRILTKLNLVNKGAENEVIDLIEDQSAKEFFHQTAPWNRLRAENFGIRALKNRLQDVLASTVRRQFPSVRNEINQKLKASKDTLRSLGDERETAEQQQRLLLDVVATFQDITQQALTAHYGVHKIFDDPELRLATLVAVRNTDFADDHTTRGHEYAFKPESGGMNNNKGDGDKGDEEDSGAGPEQKIDVDNGRSWTLDISSRKVAECGDLHEILHEGASVERSIQIIRNSSPSKIMENCEFSIPMALYKLNKIKEEGSEASSGNGSAGRGSIRGISARDIAVRSGGARIAIRVGRVIRGSLALVGATNGGGVPHVIKVFTRKFAITRLKIETAVNFFERA
ncbi:uncharacterized protein N7458_007363 [Penicillium daleae]|uniref:Dynamin-type G domain-containing protein n=1 Tax=Penicillium daleae TaxID=63821 RepID=A0AAD6C0Y8_9EURO|nr:uncharacterized protein N7458_007363 [Penicillium daleae]KAJ5443491.1 hypothetical protein N7458_007363 [Penicillium daleae]